MAHPREAEQLPRGSEHAPHQAAPFQACFCALPLPNRPSLWGLAESSQLLQVMSPSQRSAAVPFAGGPPSQLPQDKHSAHCKDSIYSDSYVGQGWPPWLSHRGCEKAIETRKGCQRQVSPQPHSCLELVCAVGGGVSGGGRSLGADQGLRCAVYRNTLSDHFPFLGPLPAGPCCPFPAVSWRTVRGARGWDGRVRTSLNSGPDSWGKRPCS